MLPTAAVLICVDAILHVLYFLQVHHFATAVRSVTRASSLRVARLLISYVAWDGTVRNDAYTYRLGLIVH
jgi:hypothetical protein